MSVQEEAIAPEENVLRRVPGQWINLTLSMPVSRLAFQASRRDTDGLSVFRENFISAEQLATVREHPEGYFVDALNVGKINELNLTVLSDHQPEQLPGHSIIPELSYPNCKAHRQKAKEVQVKLAKLASKQIVYSPL